jgi:hypothetical protein
VARGALAPEDTKRIEFWQGQMLIDPAIAELELSRMPGKRLAPLTTSTSSSVASGAFPEDRIVATAKDARKANPTAFGNDAAAVEAYLRTPQGKEDYEQYRDAIIKGDGRFPMKKIGKP